MTATFVNEDARQRIELYWVNEKLSEDDPERLVRSLGRKLDVHRFMIHESLTYTYNSHDVS